MPYLFSGMLIESVAKTAETMVEEIRRQFEKDPLILQGKKKPDCNRCINISSKGSLKEMKMPAFIAVASPLAAGFIFRPSFLGGLLIGATLSAIILAIFAATAKEPGIMPKSILRTATAEKRVLWPIMHPSSEIPSGIR